MDIRKLTRTMNYIGVNKTPDKTAVIFTPISDSQFKRTGSAKTCREGVESEKRLPSV
jgi:hypothetical protein